MATDFKTEKKLNAISLFCATLSCAAISIGAVMLALPAVPAQGDQTIERKQVVLPLTGHLNSIPVINSNSPEVVKSEGILLSTNSREGKASPQAHLDRAVNGRFDIFLHHINNREPDRDNKTLYIGVLLSNPGHKTAQVKVLEAASYLSQPDAPFIKLESVLDNANSTVFAGPGDRITNDLLRHATQLLTNSKQKGVHSTDQSSKLVWPESISIKPQETVLLKALPIPVKDLTPQINGRSGLIRLVTNQPICAATVGLFSDEEPPANSDFITALKEGSLSTPRDKPPSSLDADGFAYGRVSGISLGNTWKATLRTSLDSQSELIELPASGDFISFVVSAVDRGTFGTGQVQSAPMLVRYPDTAYKAHGNYAVDYDLTLNLVNHSSETKRAFITFETPIKSKTGTGSELTFYLTPPNKVFFRGTIKITYPDDHGKKTERFVHLVENQGQPGEKLVSLTFKPKERKEVRVELIYPPDATPPQVITVGTYRSNKIGTESND